MAALVLAVFLLINEFPLAFDIKPVGPWCGPSVDVQLTVTNQSGRTLWLGVERALLQGEPISYSYTAPHGGGGSSSIGCGGPTLLQRVNSPRAVRLEPGQELQWVTTLNDFPVSKAKSLRVSFPLAASPDRTQILRLMLESAYVNLQRDPRTGCLEPKRAS